MSKTELITKVIAKCLLILGVITIFAGGACIESLGIAKILPIVGTGILLAAPDVLIWIVGGLYDNE